MCLHNWLISEFKTFNVKDRCFVLIFKKSTNFASQSSTGLRVVYILLYGFIYFNCANHLEDFFFFFPRVPFRICSALFCFVLFSFPGILSIWKGEVFQPLELQGSLVNRRTAGKTGLKGWFLSGYS